MIQQLKFSPVENVLTVLFVVAILGYLVYLLDLSLQNKQRGKHTVSRATVVSKGQSTVVGQPVLPGRQHGKFRDNGDRKCQECHF